MEEEWKSARLSPYFEALNPVCSAKFTWRIKMHGGDQCVVINMSISRISLRLIIFRAFMRRRWKLVKAWKAYFLVISSTVFKYLKRIRFTINGTSTLSEARQVVGKIGKEVFLGMPLVWGTQYGIGMFCLTETGEQQIDWAPEKEGKVCHLLNSHAKIYSGDVKNMADKFTKITISTIWEAL